MMMIAGDMRLPLHECEFAKYLFIFNNPVRGYNQNDANLFGTFDECTSFFCSKFIKMKCGYELSNSEDYKKGVRKIDGQEAT